MVTIAKCWSVAKISASRTFCVFKTRSMKTNETRASQAHCVKRSAQARRRSPRGGHSAFGYQQSSIFVVSLICLGGLWQAVD